MIESNLFNDTTEKGHIIKAFDTIIHKNVYSIEINTIIDSIINYDKAWIKIVEFSNSRTYLLPNNWIMEGFFRQNTLNNIKQYLSTDNFITIFSNGMKNRNYGFLERFLKYSRFCFTANFETKIMYDECIRLFHLHSAETRDKNYIKIPEILIYCKYYINILISNFKI